VTVLLVDYGMGNLGSARRALEECGATVTVSANPADAASADRIVIPGVGAFPEAMRRLNEKGWTETLRRDALQNQIPVLGICLGMQLLAQYGHEGEKTEGLGFIPGHVTRLEPVENERVPHVGWNEVWFQSGSPLFAHVKDGSDFYFVHSYQFVAEDPSDVVAATPYCGRFVSAVARGKVFGVQFHPEKSSQTGFQVIRNFLAV
jgi:imidazole glycerol-phosphate synthase subunit HisH